jgi:hypothetical protein
MPGTFSDGIRARAVTPAFAASVDIVADIAGDTLGCGRIDVVGIGLVGADREVEVVDVLELDEDDEAAIDEAIGDMEGMIAVADDVGSDAIGEGAASMLAEAIDNLARQRSKGYVAAGTDISCNQSIGKSVANSNQSRTHVSQSQRCEGASDSIGGCARLVIEGLLGPRPHLETPVRPAFRISQKKGGDAGGRERKGEAFRGGTYRQSRCPPRRLQASASGCLVVACLDSRTAGVRVKSTIHKKRH